MGRLIDADVLLESLIHCDGLGRKSLEVVIKHINKQPTAYDTEKVVEQLEEKINKAKSDLSGNFMMVVGMETAYKDAIEIVRNGGEE